MKKHCMISFDSDSWDTIRQLLGLLGQLKCKYCGVVITKDNVGGVANPKEVFCQNTCCLVQHVMDQNEKNDVSKQEGVKDERL